MYDIPSAKLNYYQAGDEEKPVDRTGPPPCEECPKGSPDNEHLNRLTWANGVYVTLYERLRTGVYQLPVDLELDPVLVDKFREIKRIMDEIERADSARALALAAATMRNTDVRE